MSDTSISASERAKLPPLPDTIGVLTTDQSRALDQRYEGAAVSTLEDCITCKGRKEFAWFVRGSRSEATIYECPCRDQYRLARWLWHCGIMRNYQRLEWLDFEVLEERTAEAISEYLGHLEAYRDAGIGLTFSGPQGTGKTLLAHLILKEIIGKGVDVYATSFSAMINTYAEGWRDREQARWFNARVRDAGVLFIDDLGREHSKTVGDNMLETVIRHRVGCQLPTFITSNLDHEKMSTAYGGHTDSLLEECSIRVEVPGIDSRPRMKQREIDLVKRGLTRPVVL